MEKITLTKLKKGSWPLLLMLFLSTTISYIDRQVLSVASPVIRNDFGLTNFDYSQIVFAFLFAYAVFQPLMGRLADKIGLKFGYAIIIGLWSIATGLHSLALGFWTLFVFRFLLGASESGTFPSNVKAVSENFSPERKAFASGIFNIGAGVGAVIAPPLVAWMILNYRWEDAFLVTGSLGFIWMIVWLGFYKKPIYPRVSEDSETKQIEWKRLLKVRELWGLMLARFISDPVWYFYLFWIPEYLSHARGFNITEIGLFAWIPFLTADVGSIVGGSLNSFLIDRGWSVDRARKTVMGSMAALMPVAIIAVFVKSPVWAIALICLATFGHQAWSANILTLPADLFPSRAVGTSYGISAMAGGIGGMLFTLLVGKLADTVGYVPVFVMVGLMHLIAFCVVLVTIRKIKQVDLET